MMNSYVTVAISETWPRNFKIILYDLKLHLFQEREVNYEDFFDEQKRTVWDLFHITEWDGRKGVLKGKLETERLLAIFRKHTIAANNFLRTQSPDRYAIVKVDQIQEIHMPEWSEGRSQLKQRITFVSKGELIRSQLNKDYRWIEYWKNIDESLWEQKCSTWKEFLNESSNSVYVIYYKHFYGNKTQKWLVGFHCFKKGE